MEHLVSFIRDIRAKFGIPNLSQSQDTGENSDWGIYDFQISGQCLISKNFRNSSDDIDMKLGPVTKHYKKNTARSKKFDEFSESCDVIVIFPIYSQFGAIRKPGPGRINYKTYIFNNSNLLSYKNGKYN